MERLRCQDGSQAETPATGRRSRRSGAKDQRVLKEVTKNGNLAAMPGKSVSPVGASIADDIRRREKRDAVYRKIRARLSRAEAVARLLIQFRMRHALTQEQLAKLMGTSVPTISRLESGTHVPSLTTLSRVAEAAGEKLVIGFERSSESSHKPERTLVSV